MVPALEASTFHRTSHAREDDAATMPLKDFKKLQRLIGGGSKALLPQSVIVRAFVVRGKNIRPLDPSGLCDPYMKVDLLGTGKRFGNRRDHVKETLAPWFYKMFQFTTELPGSSQLQFKLYDWDKNGGDDVIGDYGHAPVCALAGVDAAQHRAGRHRAHGLPPAHLLRAHRHP